MDNSKIGIIILLISILILTLIMIFSLVGSNEEYDLDSKLIKELKRKYPKLKNWEIIRLAKDITLRTNYKNKVLSLLHEKIEKTKNDNLHRFYLNDIVVDYDETGSYLGTDTDYLKKEDFQEVLKEIELMGYNYKTHQYNDRNSLGYSYGYYVIIEINI